MIKYHPVRLNELVEHYMDCRTSKVSAVSVAVASKAVKTVMPDCPLRDRELADLIATSAIRHGYAVSFDLKQQRSAST
jgi:hypothetical protein